MSWWAYLHAIAQSYQLVLNQEAALALTKYWEFDLDGSSLNQNNLWDPPRVFKAFTQNCEHSEDEVQTLNPLPTSGLLSHCYMDCFLVPSGS